MGLFRIPIRMYSPMACAAGRPFVISGSLLFLGASTEFEDRDVRQAVVRTRVRRTTSR